MKNVKMLLGSIAVLAVVGTGLAFKSSSFVSKKLFYINTSGVCTAVNGRSITGTTVAPIPGDASQEWFTAKDVNNTCQNQVATAYVVTD